MASMPKKDAPTPEIIRAEAATFETTKIEAPIAKATRTKKVAIADQIVDVQITERYPRSADSENYKVTVNAPMTGVPTLRLAPKGWVGPEPLVVPESRIDELIQLLTKVR